MISIHYEETVPSCSSLPNVAYHATVGVGTNWKPRPWEHTKFTSGRKIGIPKYHDGPGHGKSPPLSVAIYMEAGNRESLLAM